MAISPQDPLDAATALAQDRSPLAANLVGGAEAPARRSIKARSADSYSRFVAWMKVLLPFLALGLIALVVLWPQLKTDDTFRIGFATVRLSGDAEPGMDNVRYVGTDDNRQPYSVTADLARLVDGEEGTVDMEMPKADLTLEDGTWLVLTADSGRYLRHGAHLDLEGGVNLFHDTGYEITTDKLAVELKQGVATSATPLSGHGPFGELKAQGLRLIDKGQVIYFTGPAQLTLYPVARDGATAPEQTKTE